MAKFILGAKPALTQSYLREILHYDPDTGDFTWLVPRAQKKAGDKAGRLYVHKTSKERRWGYIEIGIDNKIYRAHRLAWLYMTGSWPEALIDHKDGDRTNNRFSNLRECTVRQNAENRFNHHGKTSQYLGVCFDKHTKKWQASIRVNGKATYLGQFVQESDAADAYLKAKAVYHPFGGSRQVRG